MKKNKASTPCLGICSTTYGDNVCKGCKRFVHEVINWNKYSIPEKELVNNRLEDFKLTVLQERLSIINPDLLASKLRENGINFSKEADIYDMPVKAADIVDRVIEKKWVAKNRMDRVE